MKIQAHSQEEEAKLQTSNLQLSSGQIQKPNEILIPLENTKQ